MSNIPLAKNPLSEVESNTPDIDVSQYVGQYMENPLSCANLLRIFYKNEYSVEFDYWENGLSVRDTPSCWKTLNNFLESSWERVSTPQVGDIAIIDDRGPHILINVGRGLYLQCVFPRPVKMRKIRGVPRDQFFGFYSFKENS